MLFYCIDDPSVLLEAETEFLNQMFGDENEICTDKENMAPNTSTLGKPASKKNKTKSPKSKGRSKRKSKDSEQSKAKKPKKVYSKVNIVNNVKKSVINSK